MMLETRYKATFSRREIIEALREKFPERIVVQAIPPDGSDYFTTPTMNATADTLDIAWSRIGKSD